MFHSEILRPSATSRARLASFPLLAVLASATLAISWLLPNFSVPWFSFHRDAWMAATLTLIALGLAARNQAGWMLSVPVLFLSAVAFLPFLQFGGGLMPLWGAMVVPAAYLVGFALCGLLGENWARLRGMRMLDVLLGGIFIAALVSVGLTLYQMAAQSLGEDVRDIWVMRFDPTLGRPYANLAQPNQLATLLLWGLCSLFWLRSRQWIRSRLVLFATAAFLLVGVALTQSRTAMLTLTVVFLLALAFFVRKRLSRADFVLIAASFGFFWLTLAANAQIYQWLEISEAFTIERRSAGEARPLIWRVFLDAAMQQPWLGYGFHNTHLALMEVFPRYPEMNNWFFNHSHNLFLDLILYFGFPIGLLLSVVIFGWFVWVAKEARKPDRLVCVLVLGVVGVHAMLELPLHYAYYLFPAGLLVGYLNYEVGLSQTRLVLSRPTALAVFAAAALFLAAIVHDYLKIEERFVDLRMEILSIGWRLPPPPEDMLLMKHWDTTFRNARMEPRAGMTPNELAEWEALVLARPSEFDIRQMMYMWSLNGNPERAEYWARRLCLVSQPVKCEYILQTWRTSLASQVGGPTPIPSTSVGSSPPLAGVPSVNASVPKQP